MNGTVLATDIKQPYAFTGREYDQETGLYYYRNRYYDVNTGRFVSKDPIGFNAGDVNLYRYVGNNPVNYIDSEGLASIKVKIPANGNLVPGSKRQDWVCTPPAPQNLNKCHDTKNCCVEHDKCYEKYGCNASSWFNAFPGACQVCDLKAAICVITNLPSDDKNY